MVFMVCGFTSGGQESGCAFESLLPVLKDRSQSEQLPLLCSLEVGHLKLTLGNHLINCHCNAP